MKHLKTYEESKWNPTHYLIIFDDNNISEEDTYMVLDGYDKYRDFVLDLEVILYGENEDDLDFEDIQDIVQDECDFSFEELEISEPLKNTNELYLCMASENYGETYYMIADNKETIDNMIIYNANEQQKESEETPSVFKNIEDAITYLDDFGSHKILKVKHTDYKETTERIQLERDKNKFNI